MALAQSICVLLQNSSRNLQGNAQEKKTGISTTNLEGKSTELKDKEVFFIAVHHKLPNKCKALVQRHEQVEDAENVTR